MSTIKDNHAVYAYISLLNVEHYKLQSYTEFQDTDKCVQGCIKGRSHYKSGIYMYNTEVVHKLGL